MKILRVKDDTLYLHDLLPWLDARNLGTGDKFAISWKIGKRRKIRSYRVESLSGWDCECCGWVSYVHLKQGPTDIFIDNHFRKGYFSIWG